MTKLPAAVGSFKNHEKVIGESDDETKRLDLNSDIKGPCRQIQAAVAPNVIDLDEGEQNGNLEINNGSTCDSDHEGTEYDDNDDEESNDDFEEPLGYQSFLYDIKIEFSPGGNLSSSLSYEHCFRMKCLPYMIENSETQDASHQTPMLDVTKETSAFLGNSDYVPNSNHKTKRVVVELVSAKLSSSNGYTIPPNSSFTNLHALEEDKPPTPSASAHPDISSLRSYNGHSSAQVSNTSTRNHMHSPSSRRVNPTSLQSPSSTPTSPSSSKRFVNYTIVIKTIPGLDKSPVVIERRFSDFLRLYQGLKDDETLVHLIEKNITFPKKVYMGNFSLEKIAQRSIEFNRLLHLCMSEYALLWSPPFVSFLIDKELNEAHRLSLFGDPDDAQAMFETVNSIKQKLYARYEN